MRRHESGVGGYPSGTKSVDELIPPPPGPAAGMRPRPVSPATPHTDAGATWIDWALIVVLPILLLGVATGAALVAGW